jgi:hypothetical protein
MKQHVFTSEWLYITLQTEATCSLGLKISFKSSNLRKVEKAEESPSKLKEKPIFSDYQ